MADPDTFVAYSFSEKVVSGYPVDNSASVMQHKIVDGPASMVMSPAVDVQRLSSITSKMIFEVLDAYQWYFCVIDDDAYLLSPLIVELLRDSNDFFVQQLLWKTESGSLFSATDRSAIAAPLEQLLKPGRSFNVRFADLVQILVDYVEVSQTAANDVLNRVELQNLFVSVARRLLSDALNDIVQLPDLSVDSCTPEPEISTNDPVALHKKVEAAEESCPAWAMLSTHRRS